jgi:hypothetical protein
MLEGWLQSNAKIKFSQKWKRNWYHWSSSKELKVKLLGTQEPWFGSSSRKKNLDLNSSFPISLHRLITLQATSILQKFVMSSSRWKTNTRNISCLFSMHMVWNEPRMTFLNWSSNFIYKISTQLMPPFQFIWGCLQTCRLQL